MQPRASGKFRRGSPGAELAEQRQRLLDETCRAVQAREVGEAENWVAHPERRVQTELLGHVPPELRSGPSMRVEPGGTAGLDICLRYLDRVRTPTYHVAAVAASPW